jgi:hypothetical protein
VVASTLAVIRQKALTSRRDFFKIRYKKEIDPKQSAAFGLIAEEVAEVNPDLVVQF